MTVAASGIDRSAARNPSQAEILQHTVYLHIFTPPSSCGAHSICLILESWQTLTDKTLGLWWSLLCCTYLIFASKKQGEKESPSGRLLEIINIQDKNTL